ncbi:hypothetical protein [Motiliproteus sediminis]|uniref:hypothetical protein n=1 Tax=Motiliproteus sediminis TaxID=1468178 RepID=UPI001AEF5639|nr:hypothetical protein [Motiliproteus sediminis]
MDTQNKALATALALWLVGPAQADEARSEMTRQYLLDRQYQSHQQRESEHALQSGVDQGAGNQAQTQGHQLSQQQGGVEVGALVSGGYQPQAGGGGFNWQFVPQSNVAHIEGDNDGVIQLTNINASNGSVHIGDVNQGNLYNSQIGNSQQGVQSGDSTSAQSNQQRQQSDSQAASQDHNRNG